MDARIIYLLYGNIIYFDNSLGAKLPFLKEQNHTQEDSSGSSFDLKQK